MELTQTAAASRAGVSQHTWSDWESGKKRPGLEQLVTLSAMTGASRHAVSLHDFVETAEEQAVRRELRHRRAS